MTRPRAHDLGIRIGTLEPGPLDAITDVAGVAVGHRTLIEGSGPLQVGHGPVRTGVSVILPHDGNVWKEPVFAGVHRLNGNGEMTGLEWIRESGLLGSPIALTNTHSVGVVRDALLLDELRHRRPEEAFWGLPVVAETWDGRLNDWNGFHVRPEHVAEAIAAASRGPVAEGSVGGGTGMIAFGFKAGIGTASRVVRLGAEPATVGVLVQANFGRRERFTVDGIPVGRLIPSSVVPLPAIGDRDPPPGAGSVIVIVATDAPLLPHQCTRLAQRAGLGIGRLGGTGETWSGDLFLAFATGNRGLRTPDWGAPPAARRSVDMIDEILVDGLFDAAIEATEEAVLNALLRAETMTGRDGVTAHALPPDALVRALADGWHPLGRTEAT